MTFEEWWYNQGSGVIPWKGDDMEEHARRVAERAWHAGFDAGIQRRDSDNSEVMT